MSFSFSKYHGAGNDFIVADTNQLDREDVHRLCRRSYGVGADGMIGVLEKDSASDVDFQMVIRNADGSRPEMCGNGLRCAVRYWIESNGDESTERVIVETDAGPRECRVVERAEEWTIETEMSEPQNLRSDVPVYFEGREIKLCYVELGNPHAIVFGQDFNPSFVENLGIFLNGDSTLFPEGVNLEYVESVTTPNRLDVSVYERGVGLTNACGTGAFAVAVAANRLGIIEQPTIEVGLMGGVLTATVEGDFLNLSGGATKVYRGETQLIQPEGSH